VVFFLLTFILVPVAMAATSSDLPYTLYYNGSIYTVDDNQKWAQAFAVDMETGIILKVGSDDEVEQYILDQNHKCNPGELCPVQTNIKAVANVVNLRGRLVLPGFQDAHLHVIEAGINSELCYIPEDSLLEDIPFIMDDCKDGGRFGGQGWILGAGIDIGFLFDSLQDIYQEYPISVLDKAFGGTPVFILDSLGHGGIANSKAMELVGYDKLSRNENPVGGVLDRDPVTGELTGIVLENAQQMFRSAAFPPTRANKEKAYESLLDALDILALNGITTVSDAGGFWKQAANSDVWEVAEQQNKLTVRASNAFYIYPDMDIQEQLSKLTQQYRNGSDSLVRFNQAKIYVDGILALGTSALLDPYVYDSNDYGFEYFPDGKLEEVADILSNAGFQLHLHATGDRGVRMALDVLESDKIDPSSGPHRLTHNYLVHEQDRSRFAELDVVADFQLSPSSFDTTYRNFLKSDILGNGRTEQLMPAIEIHNEGGLVTLSSDWDADELSPLKKISTALQMVRPSGNTFDLDSVIRMMTINPAILLQHNDRTGSIEVGKYADFVVLDTNIFSSEVDIFGIDPAKIAKTKVLATCLQGEPVYDPLPILGYESIGKASPPENENSGGMQGNQAKTFLLSLNIALVYIASVW